MGDSRADDPAPDVTVVIGAYNAMPYLVRCLESVEAQTIGAERIEIVAVDDGSTDGTGDHLDEFAARTKIPTRVVHQANSGAPGGPRNTGLGLARGRFVFFLDADDFLGDEALERLVAMADRNGTDVALGRVEGVNRGGGGSVYRTTLERTDVFSSNIKFTLSAQKLFRRDLLVRHGLRFDTSMRFGEDAPFTMEAYLRADGVSVLADYTCYYLVGREDGNHVRKGTTIPARIESGHLLADLIAAHVPAGDRRDLLMIRPFASTLLPLLGPIMLGQSPEERQRTLDLAAPMLAAYWTEGIGRRLKVDERLRLTAAALGRLDLIMDVLTFQKAGTPPEVTVRDGRRHLAYPHFGAGLDGFPDELYAMRITEQVGDQRLAPTLPTAARPKPSFARRVVRKLKRTLRR
ncbi:glycosyltransferase family 2 protein [Streptomyces purpureus]|uniref:Glycosyl transferase n=1 Tax=Streptomyces purpureus TaxID=1951 RepID=A0A918HHR7_9ACTN|nr:glycosyltransferase [Streptomyces purpureus]GGT61499.1 hypothetical protein GCM10014713_63770 [Streptomyces purpureus]